MLSLIIFNCRRTGETKNILVTDFQRRERLDDELVATLPAEDRLLAKKFCRMKIRGKLGRTVPVLIKPEVDKCIELLIRHRIYANIPVENEFLFALPTFAGQRLKRIDACALLRKSSVLCGAKYPETLRGTNMRKHVATMCVSLELNENSVSELAEFMGHHEKIHRQFYRQMPIVREIVKMSRILESAQGAYDDDDDDEAEERIDGANELNQKKNELAGADLLEENMGHIDEGGYIGERERADEGVHEAGGEKSKFPGFFLFYI